MSSSDSEVEPEITVTKDNHAIKTTYLLHKCQLNIEIEKLEQMIKATETQKEVVEILRKTASMLQSTI